MSLDMKVCCVTGHRKIPEGKIQEVSIKLNQEITLAIEDGFTLFISGFADGVDLLFAELVIAHRKQHPHLFLEAAIPYANRIRSGGRQFQRLLLQCNGIKTVSEAYHPQCFEQRNRYMVQQADRVIAVYDGRERGGTLFTMRYTQCMQKELRIIRM